MKHIIDHPQLADRLYQHADAAKALVEEILRTATSLQTLFRRVMQDCEIAGC